MSKTDKTPQQGDNISTESYNIKPLIHDSQHLQLCAIHALNNLMQLSKTSKNRTIERQGRGKQFPIQFPNEAEQVDIDDQVNGERKEMILINGEVYTVKHVECGTKEEFDSLADNLTCKEEALLMGDGEEESADLGTNKISLWRRIRSNHRTPITGNYSFEVLQTAASNRNIDLTWYSTNMKKPMQEDKQKVIIGYIINKKEPLSVFSPHRIFFDSHHWCAVTRLRRTSNTSKNGKDKTPKVSFGTPSDYSKHKWHKIDSQTNDIRDFNTDEELNEFLHQVENEGGNILQASFCENFRLT